MNNTVSIRKCTEYDSEAIYGIILKQIEELGIASDFFTGKKVVIKPNLVTATAPSTATCSHPTVVEAVSKIVKKFGGNAIIAESPGGLYTPRILEKNYHSNGLDTVSENTGIPLNFDTGYKTLPAPNGKVSKNFNIINPIADADIVVNICKLKTHTLTGMTCAVKNLFGCIPGTQKFEMHARFSDQRIFADSLIDLCDMICNAKKTLHICDAIVGMEGNGPSGGSPRNIGCIIASLNPYALDAVAAHIINHSEKVFMLQLERKRGLCPPYNDINTIGDEVETFVINDYKPSDSKKNHILTNLPPFLQPKPKITERCIGCGKCVDSCPVHTITVKDKKAVIQRSNCIKCFCCQELCPIHAIDVKRNIFLKIIK